MYTCHITHISVHIPYTQTHMYTCVHLSFNMPMHTHMYTQRSISHVIHTYTYVHTLMGIKQFS